MKVAIHYFCTLMAILFICPATHGEPDSYSLIDAGLPKWGAMGEDADLMQLYKSNKNVIIVRVISFDYVKIPKKDIFAEKIEASVTGVLKGGFSVNEKITLYQIPEGVPENDESREKKRLELEQMLKEAERVIFIDAKNSDNKYKMNYGLHAECTRELLNFLDSISKKGEAGEGNSSEK